MSGQSAPQCESVKDTGTQTLPSLVCSKNCTFVLLNLPGNKTLQMLHNMRSVAKMSLMLASCSAGFNHAHKFISEQITSQANV